jgi:hypothetical protein
MSDDKNQGGPSDFEDDFDDLEFEDIDFDETDMDTAGYEDLTDEDLQDDDFAGDDDWEEEDVAAAPARRWGKKDKGLYTDTSERKGLNLSFNTMVILGALLLGGSVLAYTVMSKTSQVNANKPSAFQSMLGIGSVFDGQIFGDGAKEGVPPQPSEDGNITALDQSSGQGGLLDNPDQALSALDGAPHRRARLLQRKKMTLLHRFQVTMFRAALKNMPLALICSLSQFHPPHHRARMTF